MAEASIPVDLFNPGQVFACMGFLEAADVLCGDAGGGFDWSNPADVRFRIRAQDGADPVETVLGFLAAAKVERLAPVGYEDPKKSENLEVSTFFPSRQGDGTALPVRLSHCRDSVDLSHWADGSSRKKFKLYAGNRSSHSITCAMLSGTREKPKKKQRIGDLKTLGVAALWDQQRDELLKRPFDVRTPMGGSFNFDPRGAWTSIDAGYSPNTQKHGVEASPVVEILAAWGLEHTRPYEYEKRRVRYGVWSGLVTPMLARPALAGIDIAVPLRRFEFVLDLSGKNKVVTFAQEEANE